MGVSAIFSISSNIWTKTRPRTPPPSKHRTRPRPCGVSLLRLLLEVLLLPEKNDRIDVGDPIDAGVLAADAVSPPEPPLIDPDSV